eukprot:3454526-Rhodomonas_salina.4
MGDYGQTPTPDDAAALLRGVPVQKCLSAYYQLTRSPVLTFALVQKGTEVTVKIKGRFAGEKPVGSVLLSAYASARQCPVLT